ncbi:MAG: right-handed parallel beta-helix repeat-containing protein [Phycisphaerae bacterium]|nr:right-handed parallel beta-helix repeat-containing protein [Phycisphaerae bacterium]
MSKAFDGVKAIIGGFFTLILINAALLLVPSASQAKTIDSSEYKTIQLAIDAANQGDIVHVKKGVYEESLTLKDGVSLEGEDANNVVIQCDMRVAPVLNINNCKNIHVTHLTLKHYNPTLIENDSDGKWAVVQIDDSGATLNHLIVCGSDSQGIRITNGRRNYDLVSVVDCNIYDNRSAGITVAGNGNAELKNNTCTNNKKSGICFKGDADGRVSGNLCKNNAWGIGIQDNAVVEVSANTCCGNKYNGILSDSKSPFNVSDNNCFDNGTTGIEINSQIKVSAVGNNCRRNGINGIYLRNGVSGIVSGNICAENKWHGISIDQYSRPNVDNNKCFANEKCGIYDDGGKLGRNKTYDNKEFHWQEVLMYLGAEDFSELEKMASLIRDEKRHFSNGNSQLNHFYYSFGRGFNQQRFDDNIKLIEKWISKYPDSVTPQIALASVIYWKAWDIRGDSYSYKVSPEAWKPFEENLSKALDVLKQAESLNVKDPALYTMWISVARGLHKMDDLEAAFQKGIAIDPTYYPLYDAHCFTYLPRWYGKQGQYEQLAAEAAESTKNEMGQSLYYLLARGAISYVKDVNQFKEFGFDYKRIKQGQKDFAKQFPGLGDVESSNRACFMACAAGDKEDARDYFMDIGDNWDKKVWLKSEEFEKYKSWARTRNED